MADARTPGTLIAERYRVEDSLGVGGMGAVYRVRDERAKSTVALKELLLPSDERDAMLTSQFELEYHTLVQLRHPSIIEVYDYSVDERNNPFYTMELLDGQDLRERAQPSWRAACGLLQDVASSLAIMHSRRLLHRDISARNIRCTSNGRAKLIDFGAMAPMGVLKHLVGTAPFVPPEALQLQALDGRADLFALGAVFYWLMTRRQAYPARNFRELPDLWRTQVPSPRQLGADLPPALDHLIMQLISLDRSTRPASAAEVIERLCGIADLSPEERPAVSLAYLATPVLVGREALLQGVRVQLIKARQAQGSTVLIEGAKGSGRSRALDAAVLEAKLLGAVVLRAEPADASSGDYGVARSLAQQLIRALPSVARVSAAPGKTVLSYLLPELRDTSPALTSPADVRPLMTSRPPRAVSGPLGGGPPAPRALSGPLSGGPAGSSGFSSPSLSQVRPSQRPPVQAPERRELQNALSEFILAVAREKHIVVVIDDMDAIDEPSATLLATLAHSAKRRKLSVLLSAPLGSHTQGPLSAVLALVRQMAARLTLEPLSAEQTEALLRSVFGDVPNVAAVSQRVHHIAAGSPRSTMELAQHLVDRGLARYEAGSWALPITLAAGDLPASLGDSIAQRVTELSDDARNLAQALALTDPALIEVPDYARLLDHQDRTRAYAALAVLVSRGLLLAAGDRYRFSELETAALLRDRLSEERAREVHGRIARVLANTGHVEQLARHQLLGGYAREGIEAVHALCEQRGAGHGSAEMLDLIERALECAERTGEPVRVRVVLACQLVYQAASRGDYTRFTRLMPEVCQRVERECGLSDYYELSDVGKLAAPDTRAREALRLTRERYAATPDHDRCFDAEEAATWLMLIRGATAIMAAISEDLSLLDQLRPAAPLSTLLPNIFSIDEIVDGQRAMQSGRFARAAEHAVKILSELEGPRYALMPPMERHRIRASYVYQLGLTAAVLGLPTTLDYVKELEHPHYRSNAWRIRMVYELMHGRNDAAQSCQRRAELYGLQDSGAVAMPGTTARVELLAAVYADDLLGVKRCMERIEEIANGYPCWASTLAIARAHYRRLQGDFAAGLVAANSALEYAPIGRHLDWALAASTQLALLNELGRAEEALELGEQYIGTAVREGLGSIRAPLLRILAECCVRAGKLEQAQRMADVHLTAHLELGTQGLQLGLAYETRARVAVAMRDEAAAQRYAEQCASQYKASRNALLSRKYQQLVREADAAGVAVATMQNDTADFTSTLSTNDAAHTVYTRLLGAASSSERAEQTLNMLLESHGAVAGYLFGTSQGRMKLLAASETGAPSDALVQTLESCIALLTEAPAQATTDDEALVQAPPDSGADSTTLESLHSGNLSDAPRSGNLDVNVDGFEPLPLFVRRGARRELVGLAAVRFEGAARKAVPAAMLAALADAMRDEET